MFLEVDLGHEGRKVWKQKIDGYLRYARSGHFEQQFGLARFRVLVLANSERRLASIRSVAAQQTDKLFWFSTLSITNAVQNREGFWSPVWLRPQGDERLALI